MNPHPDQERRARLRAELLGAIDRAQRRTAHDIADAILRTILVHRYHIVPDGHVWLNGREYEVDPEPEKAEIDWHHMPDEARLHVLTPLHRQRPISDA